MRVLSAGYGIISHRNVRLKQSYLPIDHLQHEEVSGGAHNGQNDTVCAARTNVQVDVKVKVNAHIVLWKGDGNEFVNTLEDNNITVYQSKVNVIL